MVLSPHGETCGLPTLLHDKDDRSERELDPAPVGGPSSLPTSDHALIRDSLRTMLRALTR